MPDTSLPFDAAEYLGSERGQVELLSDAFDTGDLRYILNALGIVARARGMSNVAKAVNISREGLYKALGDNGDPRLSTFLGVTSALGLRLTVTPSPKVKPVKKTTKTKPAAPVRVAQRKARPLKAAAR